MANVLTDIKEGLFSVVNELILFCQDETRKDKNTLHSKLGYH